MDAWPEFGSDSFQPKRLPNARQPLNTPNSRKIYPGEAAGPICSAHQAFFWVTHSGNWLRGLRETQGFGKGGGSPRSLRGFCYHRFVPEPRKIPESRASLPIETLHAGLGLGHCPVGHSQHVALLRKVDVEPKQGIPKT